jgi:cathepsin A (carboxypeptidase C)
LDQPANVGYSYGQDNDTNEEMISEDAYYFLQAFFMSEDGKKYKNNPLFIVGECVDDDETALCLHIKLISQ